MRISEEELDQMARDFTMLQNMNFYQYVQAVYSGRVEIVTHPNHAATVERRQLEEASLGTYA